jgi:hypothetical protein
MLKLRFLWIFPLAGGVFVACATDGSESGDAADGGVDAVPYTNDGSGYDSGGYDSSSSYDSSSGYDADLGQDTSTDGNPFPGDGGCGLTGVPCDPDAFNACNFLGTAFVCESVRFDPVDAGDGGDAGSDAGPPPKGVCIFGPIFPPRADCGGADHCPSGQRCLNGSGMCLTPPEVSCVCTNSATAGACGPPT